MTLTLILVLVNERGWRQYGEAADDRRRTDRRRFRSRGCTRVHFGIGGSGSGNSGYDGLRLELGRLVICRL